VKTKDEVIDEALKDRLIQQAVTDLQIPECSNEGEALLQVIRGVIKGFEVAEQYFKAKYVERLREAEAVIDEAKQLDLKSNQPHLIQYLAVNYRKKYPTE
jgi:hypothetical protein